eukprot:814433-Rhodomonas_salina.1
MQAGVTVATEYWDDDELCIEAVAAIPYLQEPQTLDPRRVALSLSAYAPAPTRPAHHVPSSWGPPVEVEGGRGSGPPKIVASTPWGIRQRAMFSSNYGRPSSKPRGEEEEEEGAEEEGGKEEAKAACEEEDEALCWPHVVAARVLLARAAKPESVSPQTQNPKPNTISLNPKP